ncbi:MAG: D-amino acid aminotransferase [Nitrospiraceae bacterium]
MGTVYLNGEFLPLEQATISPLDRGFIFGDGVYEVIPVYGGRLFRLEEHLLRLDGSLAGIRLASPHTHAEWTRILHGLVERNQGGNQSVYLQITRGAAKRDHAFPRDCTPTVFAMSSPLAPLPAEIRQAGIAAITLPDIRWQYCHLKTIALLPNILLRQQALDSGAAEAILIRDGEATEGAASNLFIVRDGALVTPPKGPRLLPGITRDLIMELAAHHRVPQREAAISADDLVRADEIWLSSSTKEILPVTRLDGNPVGTGAPGPLWQHMIDWYQEYKRDYQEHGDAIRGPLR